ncbi:MAG: hypothetical protein HZA88_06755 [Verrucomicrobia bacterium]|nr:hypothetical protein [Verrucomicrobiota bacterium]
MTWLPIIWSIVYVLIIVGPIVAAVWRRVTDTNFYVSVISSWAVVFLPSAGEWYVLKHGLSTDGAQVEVTMNVLLTLVSCTNIVAMFLVTYCIRSYFARLGKPQQISWAAVVYEIVLFVAAIATVFLGAANAEYFVDLKAYQGKQFIPWIWPNTVDCPMNYCRTFIGVLLLLALFFPWNQKLTKTTPAK